MVRDAGTFGQVTVPFEVVPIEPEGATTMDVSPNRGALLFNPDEQLRVYKYPIFCQWLINEYIPCRLSK